MQYSNTEGADRSSNPIGGHSPADLRKKREDIRASDILPKPDPNAVRQSDKYGPVLYGGKPIISDGVKELPRSARPEPGARPEAVPPLVTTKNNSPQPVEGEVEACPHPVVVERTDRETGEVDWVELPCDRKQCEHCGPKMRRRYVAHFAEQFSGLPNLKFVTLTLDPKAFESSEVDPRSFDESRKYLLHIWERRFVKRVKRRTEGEVKYVATVERHESGQAHLHAVMSCGLHEADLRDQWFQSGGGVVMDASRIGSDGLLAAKIGYAVKYCFKESGEKGRNSIFCSEGVGYHSEAAKEARRAHKEEEGGEVGCDAGCGRYEYEAPDGGRRGAGDAVTEDEKERFDAVAGARSTVYTRWEGDHMDPPVRGVRYEYDPGSGQTSAVDVEKLPGGRVIQLGRNRTCEKS